MRRSSVIAPLLLILIGSAFLIRNVWPDIPVVDLISRYWPFLLIAWGGLRLIEILFWAASSKPLTPQRHLRRRMGAGDLPVPDRSAMYTARHYASWLPTARSLRGMVINMGESYDYTLRAGVENRWRRRRAMVHREFPRQCPHHGRTRRTG